MRLAKAQESLHAAENCLALGLVNSCASRCYYAMFQAAVVAVATAGFHRATWSQAALQATFTAPLIHRCKLYPPALAQDLSRTLFWRNIADYAAIDISQRRARQLLAWAQAFVAAVEEVPGHESP